MGLGLGVPNSKKMSIRLTEAIHDLYEAKGIEQNGITFPEYYAFYLQKLIDHVQKRAIEERSPKGGKI